MDVVMIFDEMLNIDSKQPIERTVIEMRYNIRVLEPQLMPYPNE